MAVALKFRIFSTARELCDFVADAANDVAQVIQITQDGERFTVWYTEGGA